MKSIEKTTIHEIEIQKSKFICYMDTVHSEDDIKSILKNIQIKYPGATHYCYAYIIDNIKRFQDDGEPGGTAGMPILHVLESQDLQHIVAIVIRYFGGIKLGAGGLVRAYTNSVSECIQNASIVELEECQIIDIEFDYNNSKQIDYLLQGIQILNKFFNEKVNYKIAIKKNDVDNILQSISNYIDNYNINNETIYLANKKV